MNSPSVAIVVLNWNGGADTLACLASLGRLDYPVFTVSVVDNHSTDDSVAAIRATYPSMTLLEATENLGYVGGNNLGIEYAQKLGADYILLLNNDTEVAPDFLRHLVGSAEADPRVGIVGPTIYYFDQPGVIWSAGGGIDWNRGRTRMMNLDEPDRGQLGERPRPADFVTGCALLSRRAVFDRVGLLDPRFFAYYEEIEWCVRAARAGFKILHVPQAKLWHKISYASRNASPLVSYYMTRNRLLFLQTTRAGWRAWAHTLLLEYLRTITSLSIRPKWRSKRTQRDWMLKAVWDYFTGLVGRAPVSS